MPAVRTILTEPNPILRRRSHEVETAAIATPEVQNAIADLKATLAVSEDGIGIAAPQIGMPLRIFVVSEEAKFVESDVAPPKDKKWEYYVYINPLVAKFSQKKVEAVEGCLSVPGKYGVVTRPEKISIEAYDEAGKKFKRGASKFLARVIQHELDHLDGILFIDKVTRFVSVPQNESRL